MNEVQLRQVLACVNTHSDTKFFVGVFAADRLPRKHTKPAAFIANTDVSGGGGVHWVAFFIPERGKPEYFDSYGLDTFIEGHLDFIARSKKTWLTNKKLLQGLRSKVCGQYCLVYLICRMRGYSMKQFQSLFTKNVKKNDIQVRKCIQKYYKDDCNIKCKKRGQSCCAGITHLLLAGGGRLRHIL